jgi:hypothetical protein
MRAGPLGALVKNDWSLEGSGNPHLGALGTSCGANTVSTPVGSTETNEKIKGGVAESSTPASQGQGKGSISPRDLELS